MSMSAAASSSVAGYAGPSALQASAALPAWGTRRTPLIVQSVADRSRATTPATPVLPTRADLDYQGGALARQARTAAQLHLATAAGMGGGARSGTAVLTAKDLKQRQDMDLVLHMMGITGVEPMAFSIDWSQGAPAAPAALQATPPGMAGWGSAYGFPELFGTGAFSGSAGLPALDQGGHGSTAAASPTLAQLQLAYGQHAVKPLAGMAAIGLGHAATPFSPIDAGDRLRG